MKRLMVGLLAAVFLFVGVSAACAGTVNLSWDYDAAQESSIQGYRVYYGTVSQAGATDPVDLASALPYAQRVELSDPALRSHSLVLSPGLYYFRMTAYGLVNGSPDDSAFNTTEVSVQVGIATVTNISFTISYP